MAGRRNRSRGWRRPAVVLARSSAYLPSILASNAVSVRGLRGLATPTLWGAALRQRCDRNVQRPRLNLLLEHDHSPECVARALSPLPVCRSPRSSLGTLHSALSQLAWAHSKAVEPAPAGASLRRSQELPQADLYHGPRQQPVLVGYGDHHPLRRHAVLTPNQLVGEAPRPLVVDEDGTVRVGGLLGPRQQRGRAYRRVQFLGLRHYLLPLPLWAILSARGWAQSAHHCVLLLCS